MSEICDGCECEVDEVFHEPSSNQKLCRKCYDWVVNRRDDVTEDARVVGELESRKEVTDEQRDTI